MADSSLFPTTIRAEGLADMVRDLGRFNLGVKKGLQKELRRVADIPASAIQRFARQHHFSEPTIAGIRPGSSRGYAVVRQIRRKKTGSRPDFGSIQFRFAFVPGAEEAEPHVVREVEHFIDRLGEMHGLGQGGVS